MNWGITLKLISTGFGGVIGYLFGGWSLLLQILLILMVIDILSGFIASWIEGKLCSKVSSRGIAKKVFILLIVVVANLIEQVLTLKGVYTGESISDGAIFFYLWNELLSIIENAGRASLPLPKQLTNAVAVLKGK